MTNEYDAAKDAHDSYYAAIEAKRLRGDSHCWESLPRTRRRTVSFGAACYLTGAFLLFLACLGALIASAV